MKKLLLGFLFGSAALTTVFAQAKEIVIKGTIKFPDDRFIMEVYRYDGPEKIVIDSFMPNSDKTFEKRIKIDSPGIYVLNCQKWESLRFWGEDENIEINFRGQDTAKVKIKNPMYHPMINPGPNNELMNLINFIDYRAYQNMIAAGKEIYNAEISDCQAWKDYVKDGYERSTQVDLPYELYAAEHYGSRNSVIALLPTLQIHDKALHDQIIAEFAKTKPNYAPILRYKKAQADAAAAAEKLLPGKVAPAFEYPAAVGKKTLSPKSFKGKYLVIDFWASWCGPCRKSIPHLKEVYAKYNKSGLEILSVSIDGDAKAWKKALSEEAMPWSQVCAPHSGKEVMIDYQFNGIPHLVLLDKEGKIVATGISGEQLDEYMKTFFGK